MTQNQKIIARYNLIMEQTTKAQGDMERTLNSTTNVLRTMWEQIQELGILIGDEFKPYVTAAAKAMRDWLVDNKDDIAAYVGRVVRYVGSYLAGL